MKNVINKKLNISGFSNIEKAYTEGIYSDTPANKKLGRVGMTYKEFSEKIKPAQDSDKNKKKILLEKMTSILSSKLGFKIDLTIISEKKWTLSYLGKDEKKSSKINSFFKDSVNKGTVEVDYDKELDETFCYITFKDKDIDKNSINKKLSDITINKIFKNSVREDTKKDLTKFFLQAFNKKEKYQIPLDSRSKLWNEGKIENVKIEDIVPSQDYLNKDVIEEKLKNKDKNEEPLGISLYFNNPDNNKIEKNKKVILFDGHHRIAADILEGKKEIKMKLIPSYNLFKQYNKK